MGLFKQLFVLSAGGGLIAIYTPEFSLQFREGPYPKVSHFWRIQDYEPWRPQNSMQGRICMLSSLQGLPSEESKMKQKVQVTGIREKIRSEINQR